MKAIVPIDQTQVRLPEAGRIRMGKKVVNERGKSSPKSTNTFRLTSPDKELVEAAAALYGGTPAAWHDDKASPRDQWEVQTDATRLHVLLPGNPLSRHYEQWSGGGVGRRCDGITVQVPGQDDMIEKPCICDAKQVMECKPHARLKVLLPHLPLKGSWRLESKGWDAWSELPAMEELISELQLRGISQAELRLDRVERMVRGQKRNFVVPRLALLDSPMQILAGAGSIATIGAGARGELASVPTPALPAAIETPVEVTPAAPVASQRDWFDPDEEPVDAELVDPEPPPPPPEEETKGRRRQDPQMTKLVLLVAELATTARTQGAMDASEDDVRHGLAWKISKGRTESSKDLTSEEKSKVIDALVKVQQGKTPMTWLAGVTKEFMEKPL